MRESGGRSLNARYDAAAYNDEATASWTHADYLDADSANSREVRHTLISRSRYEQGNSGYSSGIHWSYAVDVVGSGPTLRMQTGSTLFNQAIENDWRLWATAMMLRRKLTCLAAARTGDGEGWARFVQNPTARHWINLDLDLLEAEQVQTPALAIGEPGQIDGVKFDKHGNPLWFDVLAIHPGSMQWMPVVPEAERVPAAFMAQWFQLRRPGQHRGVPQTTPSLGMAAAGRRFREATVGAAETAANHDIVLQTQGAPNDETQIDPLAGMTQFEMARRRLMSAPMGWAAAQMKAEHPSTTFEMFNRALVSEQARPLGMPYGRAAADSSSYNFASARMDLLGYGSILDSDRLDCNDLVLEPLFDLWFRLRELIRTGSMPDPSRPLPAHAFDWPAHPVADQESAAKASDVRLRNGSLTLSAEYAAQGKDLEDSLVEMAADYGVTVDQMRRVLLLTHYPLAAQVPGIQPQQQQPPQSQPQQPAESDLSARRNGHGNGKPAFAR